MTLYENMKIKIPEKLFKKKKIAVFDIDNTLIDITRRYRKSIEEAGLNPHMSLYKNPYEKRIKFWKIFLSGKYIETDHPDKEAIDIVERKYQSGYGIIILTGRPIEMKRLTEKQLKDFKIPYDLLIMRPSNNREPDNIFKPKVISKLLEEDLNITEYHEDDPATISYIKEKYGDAIKVHPHNLAKKKLIFHTRD